MTNIVDYQIRVEILTISKQIYPALFEREQRGTNSLKARASGLELSARSPRALGRAAGAGYSGHRPIGDLAGNVDDIRASYRQAGDGALSSRYVALVIAVRPEGAQAYD